jgi:hypothetical protein
MVETRQDLAFLLKTFQYARIRMGRLNHFDGYGLLETALRSLGQVHGAHSAASQHALNREDSHAGSRPKVHLAKNRGCRRSENAREKRLSQTVMRQQSEHGAPYLGLGGLALQILDALFRRQFHCRFEKTMNLGTHSAPAAVIC